MPSSLNFFLVQVRPQKPIGVLLLGLGFRV